MIGEDDALELLKKYKLPRSRVDHSIGVAQQAFRIATSIHARNPHLACDPEKVARAALLHDIGRCMPGDHELNTITILKNEGLDELASITMHGSFFEIQLLRGIDSDEFLPTTLENKIVAYADATFKDKPVTLEERWKEIEQRRVNEDEKIASIHMSKERFFKIEQELMALMRCE
ncbi:MAG TPA: HD domain-containing protein [Chitinispirillaceae bacterium]|nr:HD domain-containing protein [Chitinispirillaceae bacterium]